MSDSYGGCGMIFVIIVIVLALTIGQIIPGKLADENKAINLLEKQGFSNIRLIGEDYWWVIFKGGSSGDSCIFTFEATNPSGKKVLIDSYVGWPWKGATLRSN